MKRRAAAIPDGMYGASSAAALAASGEWQRGKTYTYHNQTKGRGRQAGEITMTKSVEFTPTPPPTHYE